MRFFGNIEARIDSKGRVFLPSLFRKVLQASGDESLVISPDLSGRCLKLYPESAWNDRMDALFARVDEYDEEEMLVVRQYMAQAETVLLDGAGRFIIARRYIEAAGLNQSVRFIGMKDTIEIWSAELTERPFLDQQTFSGRIKQIMSRNTP